MKGGVVGYSGGECCVSVLDSSMHFGMADVCIEVIKDGQCANVSFKCDAGSCYFYWAGKEVAVRWSSDGCCGSGCYCYYFPDATVGVAVETAEGDGDGVAAAWVGTTDGDDGGGVVGTAATDNGCLDVGVPLEDVDD